VPTGGDVLLTIDGGELLTVEELGSYLSLERSPGDEVELRVLRDGAERTLSLELGTQPETPA
jgi:S1-C subfamily serine protease